MSNPLIQISVSTLRCSTHGKSWSEGDTDVSFFRLGRKTTNFTGAVRWSTNSIRQVRFLSVVINIYLLYNDKKKESCTTKATTTTRAFSSLISWLAITASPDPVLSKLMLLGTVKMRTLGKVAEVAKRVARVPSLPSAEPAFNQFQSLYSFFGIFFYGGPDPWIHGSDWPAKRNAGPMVTERNHWGWGRETSLQGPCITGQPIKIYGHALRLWQEGDSALLLFDWWTTG